MMFIFMNGEEGADKVHVCTTTIVAMHSELDDVPIVYRIQGKSAHLSVPGANRVQPRIGLSRSEGAWRYSGATSVFRMHALTRMRTYHFPGPTGHDRSARHSEKPEFLPAVPRVSSRG